MADRTELWVAEKMLQLMQEKPLTRIRITEICERSGIERSTFYYHFKDKYDLIAWLFHHQAYSADSTDIREEAGSLQRMRDAMAPYMETLKDPSVYAVWQNLQEYYVDYYTDRAMALLHTDALDAQLLFTIRLYCCGAASIIREWIAGNSPVPAEILVRMMHRSMPESLQQIYLQ